MASMCWLLLLSFLTATLRGEAVQVAFTVDGKKYQLEVDPAEAALPDVARSFCLQHAEEMGASDAGLQANCVSALVPIMEEVIERQKWSAAAEKHHLPSSGSQQEEVITAEINIGSTAFSIPFHPSDESIRAESYKFCKNNAKSFGLLVDSPASMANCQQPVSSVLQEAMEGYFLELQAESSAHDSWDDGWN